MSKKALAAFAIALLALPALTLAQSYTASIRGVVTDASQAGVPGAKVVATDVNHNIQHSATTDTAGRYVFTALPPGRYNLSVEAAGFNKYSHAEFELQVQQQATIDVPLTAA